jgi:hypothetical protein
MVCMNNRKVSTMRVSVIALAVFGLAVVVSAQPAVPHYVVQARLLAGNIQNPQALQTLASPQLRTTAGRSSTMELGEAPNGYRFHLEVTPSDLGEGRVGLRVVAETRDGGRVARTAFDLVSGSNMTAPTVALRDNAGAFMVDKQGRPMFLEFSASAQRQEPS